MAALARLPGAFHGMEFVAAGAALDAARQEKKSAYADHLQPAACSRFRRPPDLSDSATAEGWHDRARRSLRIHRVCARRGARRASRLGAGGLQRSTAARSHALFQGADRNFARAIALRPRQAEISR